ncbi:hypothetical protein DVH24_013617 [Malus domestica]|uniref:SHSP domain-containing protein n=1 Tax=Malus domestica TaxID=3750 RepID=A0A498JHZ6_MALDO|nr:hypothetical protein DVH24_013617 [Malus domestica]
MAYQISNRKSSGQESNDRSRTSGANTRPRQSHRTIYEDFQPHFELMEEQEAHIVQVHLPGFVKEQAKIKFMQNPSVIRVYGQRPLGDNKWSRFNQTFPVQQNCDASKIHGKFSNGILTITIPKKVITWTATAKPIKEPPPKTAATTAEPKTHKVQDDLIPSKPSLTTSAGPPKTAIIPKIAASAQGEQQGGKTSAQEVSVAAASKAEKASFTTRDEKEMRPTNSSILVRRLSHFPLPFVPLLSLPNQNHNPLPTANPIRPVSTHPEPLHLHLSGPIRPAHNEDNPNLAAKQLLLNLFRLSAPIILESGLYFPGWVHVDMGRDKGGEVKRVEEREKKKEPARVADCAGRPAMVHLGICGEGEDGKQQRNAEGGLRV